MYMDIVKMSILPNLINGVDAIPIKIPANYFDIDKLILKFIWRGKRCRTASSSEGQQSQRTDTTQL